MGKGQDIEFKLPVKLKIYSFAKDGLNAYQIWKRLRSAVGKSACIRWSQADRIDEIEASSSFASRRKQNVGRAGLE